MPKLQQSVGAEPLSEASGLSMSLTAEPSTLPAKPLSPGVSKAIEDLYLGSGVSRYGVSEDQFLQFVTAVITKYAADSPESEQFQLLTKLHIDELILARACSAGNEAAWTEFLTRFRASLYESAYRIAGNDTTGREIADELYAHLYGLPNSAGRRVSKLDYYMGRGSLEGWLRTVLAQHHIDRCRSYSRSVSLEEQVEAGASFPAAAEPAATLPDPCVDAALGQALDELNSEDRFILASYYLDQRTLAELARTLRVHESTMSRRLERITTQLRKRLVYRLRASGLSARECDELLDEVDVRDLSLDLGSRIVTKLRQESPAPAFYKKNGSAS
jgi:RNA polymerase sigma factor (sigma-70 family)